MMSERYPGPWRGYEGPQVSPEFIPIAAALAQYHIEGCGEFYYRLAADDPGEAVVFGTSDGKTWHRYIVHFKLKQPLVRVVDRADMVPPPPY